MFIAAESDFFGGKVCMLNKQERRNANRRTNGRRFVFMAYYGTELWVCVYHQARASSRFVSFGLGLNHDFMLRPIERFSFSPMRP